MSRAMILSRLEHYDEALTAYDEAEKVFEAHGITVEVARCRENRGNTF